jgi:hypothetical protein
LEESSSLLNNYRLGLRDLELSVVAIHGDDDGSVLLDDAELARVVIVLLAVDLRESVLRVEARADQGHHAKNALRVA